MNFNITDGDTIDYEQAKQDYINGLRSKSFRKKYNIGASAYGSLLKRFREDGIEVHVRGKYKTPTAKYYHYNKVSNHYVVTRKVKGKSFYFGYFLTEKEAQARVEELKQNNWEGLL